MRRPRFRAANWPVLISSYIAVRPMPDRAHASAMLYANTSAILGSLINRGGPGEHARTYQAQVLESFRSDFLVSLIFSGDVSSARTAF